jgi:hypothetical protein
LVSVFVTAYPFREVLHYAGQAPFSQPMRTNLDSLLEACAITDGCQPREKDALSAAANLWQNEPEARPTGRFFCLPKMRFGPFPSWSFSTTGRARP